MDLVNSVCTKAASVLLLPFADWPLFALVFWGAIAGSLMTFIYARASNQTALARVGDRTRAQLFAVRLFRDDLGVTLRCQQQLLKLIGSRLWYSIPPMLVLIVPFFIVLSQLALRYESRPLVAGDHATVHLYLADSDWDSFRNSTLQVSDGLSVETPGLRDDRSRSIAWRVRSDNGQPGRLTWQLGNQLVEKTLSATSTPSRLSIVSQARSSESLWFRALHPAESSLPADGAVSRVTVDYPHVRVTPVAGWDIPWWATFLTVSMVAAYVVGAIMAVKF